MKVAIVHDDLVQWGGAERVLLGICELFPQAPIFTLAFDKQNPLLKKKFADKKITTSFIQKLPFWRRYFKATLPLQPLAFEQFDFSEYDLVISQTTRFAKSIITSPKTLHICYCHTPPRFLWNFSGENIWPVLLPLTSFLRLVDRVSAQKVNFFWAGSENAKKRIKKVYQHDSEVLLPFINFDQYKNYTGFDGGYFLVIARLNDYKRVDLVVKVFNKLKLSLKVVGTGPRQRQLQQLAGDNIEFMGRTNENLLTNLIAGCRGLIVTAEEDFGLTPLEAQALGKGVIAFGQGGVLETVIEGKTGLFFREQTEQSLEQALINFEKIKINPQDCINQAAKFSKQLFQQTLSKLVKQAENMLT